MKNMREKKYIFIIFLSLLIVLKILLKLRKLNYYKIIYKSI